MKDNKQKMSKSCTNGFSKNKTNESISYQMNSSKISAYDDSDSIFRTSMKGFFTGRSKTNNFTTQDSSYNTMDRSSYSSLVSNNDQAFSGNPLKALKHGRK
jgi:hypothetical protein